ncbi:RNA polymerase sigma factor [Bacillus sp. SA1-12]|uniref:RNA polymerase sigma-70 factor n=1 Tax=Bacillus sp. SA1-12 TaxID=1455638 RepID=UPI000627385B|nr:RNA polymerase sigma-70 factor [Bacillus sp. SA1-12]KKI89539.1 RNA polymerase sigma factor [Bacillus sp. SA1-12]
MQITNEDYQQLKPLLFSLGYRMLGSAAETEDLVQETFLKAYQIDEYSIENKKAFLCKMMTNRCLDVLKSARYKREQYVGPWNPEPLMLDQSADPSEHFLQKEGLSIAYLRMMEHLTPDERAVLLLREVFDFSYSEIAETIEKKEENCRKIYSRAKHKISRVEDECLNYEKNKSIVNLFIQAFQRGNIDDLLNLISENIILYSDGGGKVRAAIRPIITSSNVTAFLFGIIKKHATNFSFEVKNVNGQPAIIIYMNERIYCIVSFYILEGEIYEMYMTLNPEKLPEGERKK